MIASRAFTDGVLRVRKTPGIFVTVFVLTFVSALPFSLALRAAIRGSFGNSLAAEEALRGVNYQWWTEFAGAHQAGIAQTFTTSVIGFAAVLDNMSALLDQVRRPSALVMLGGAYLLFWLFLTGGIIDRYARSRPTRVDEFFAACGVYFVRFSRLAAIVGVVYWALFRYVHPWLFDDLYGKLTRNMTSERSGFAWRLSLYALFGLLLLVVNVVADFTKVRAVVEDRRSMVGAIGAGLRFVRRNIADVAMLYGLNAVTFVALLFVYALVAPGAGNSGLSLLLGFIVSQAYLAARLWIRLLFLASETALFQLTLAQPGYVASPAVPLSDPPIVEQLLTK